MKRFGNYILLAFLAAAVLSCGKEAVLADESIVNAPVASASGDEGEAGQSSDEPAGEPSVSPKDDFVDNVDWSAYDNSRYLIGFGADSESAVRMSVAGQSSDEGSRVTIDPSTMWRQWDNGDEVKVYVPASGESGLYKYDSSKKQFRPKNEENVVELDGRLAYIYYPASIFSSYSAGVATVTMPAAVTYNSVSDLGEKLPMAGLIPAGKDIASVLMVHFKNLSSIFRLSLTGCETVTSVQLSNADVPLAGSGSVTWNGSTVSAVPTLATAGGSTSMTVSCGDGVTLNESTPTEFYFLLPSSGSMSELTVTVNFTQSDGTYTYTPYITKTRSTTLTLGRSQNIRYALRAGFFSGGDGSALNPYQIETPEDLYAIGNVCQGTDAEKGYNATPARTYFSTAHYQQTAAIDMTGVDGVHPIGSVTWPFLGSYNGAGYAISNCTIADNASYQVGLFGKVHGGTIEGVRLQSSSISSTNTESSTINVAGVVAYLSGDGTVDDCQVISTSVQGLKTGGVVGYVLSGTVSDCQARGVTVQSQGTYLVDAVATYGYAGGVVGGTKDAAISGCRCWDTNADGTGTASSISGGGVAGGIAGYIAGNSGTTNVTDVYVTDASIETTGNSAGGAIGYIYAGGSLTGRTGGSTYQTVKSASVSAADYAGGLAGTNRGTITGTKYDSNTKYLAITKSVTINATNYAGGLCGIHTGAGVLDGCYVTDNTVTASNEYAGGLCGSIESTVAVTKCLTRSSTIMAYDGTSTYGRYVGGLCGYLGASSTIDGSDLTADSGRNNTISGYGYIGGVCGQQLGTIVGSSTYCMCQKTTITASSYFVGGISGTCGGAIEDCIVGASSYANTFTGVGRVGGVVGSIESTASVSGCNVSYTTLTSTSSGAVGGIIGRVAATAEISDCQVSGLTLSSSGSHHGGIVGAINADGDATISGCTAASLTITAGGNNLGGILGYVYGAATISDCTVSSISISSSANSGVGGVVGRVGETGDSKAGTLTMSDCTASGTITASSAQAVGGIVGLAWNKENLTITGCINTASVSGKEFVGGVVGRMIGGLVEQCRSKANITASLQNAGGIAGLMNGGTVATCYASGGTVTGEYAVGGLVGKMYSTESRTVVINSAARMSVTSTGNAGASVYNCASGGLVGTMQSVTSDAALSQNACVYNSVAFDSVVKNTSADDAHCIGGIVGFVTGEVVTDKTKHLSIIRNCYAQTASSYLKYKYGGTEIQCPSGNYCGGIFGRLYRGRAYDCYYRCTQTGDITDAQLSYAKNFTSIKDAAKNGTDYIDVALTLQNERTVTKGTKYLYQVMTLGSYSGTSGSTAVTLGISKGGSIALSEWVTYTASSNYFAVPKVLYDLGADYYKN